MPRVDTQELDRASARLGEAALDPALWPQLMDEICRAVGAGGAGLLQTDLHASDIPVTDSAKDIYAEYFRQGWNERDLRARAAPLLCRGVPVVTDEDAVTPDEMRKAPYFNELIFPYGYEWFAAIGFSAAPNSYWALSIHRTPQQGQFNAKEKKLLAALSRHLTEVATLSTAVGRIALSGSVNALSSVRHPAIAVDRLGIVLEANPAIESILGEDIRIRNRRLVVADSRAQAAFETLKERMAACSDTAALSDPEPIVVRRAGRVPVLVRVLPVPPAARNPFLGARAILTFVSLEPKPRPVTALLAQAFGLTPAESRLAAALANGTALDAAADERGICRETARNHLKSIFLKTGTHRQSQLVALLARL